MVSLQSKYHTFVGDICYTITHIYKCETFCTSALSGMGSKENLNTKIGSVSTGFAFAVRFQGQIFFLFSGSRESLPYFFPKSK